MRDWLLLGGVVAGSLLIGFILGWMVSRIPFGFALGCPLSVAAPSAVMLLLLGAYPIAVGLGLWGAIPCVVGCAFGFVAFRNPET